MELKLLQGLTSAATSTATGAGTGPPSLGEGIQDIGKACKVVIVPVAGVPGDVQHLRP